MAPPIKTHTLNTLREAVLGEWLALETQTDVISVDLAEPAKGGYRPDRFRLAEPAASAPSPAGDDHQALTFGALP